MDLAGFFSHGLEFAGTFSPTIALFLFLICFIGEAFAIAIPYLLETTWLMAGYQLGRGLLSPFELVLLLLAAQAGRQLGAVVFGMLGRFGVAPLIKYLQRFKWMSSLTDSGPVKAVQRINILSPFSVALGRLLWLRIPLTLILSSQKRMGVLAIAVLISGIIWDCVYVAMGGIVGIIHVEPGYAFAFFLVCLTAVYVIGLMIRRHHAHAVNGSGGKSA